MDAILSFDGPSGAEKIIVFVIDFSTACEHRQLPCIASPEELRTDAAGDGVCV